MNRYGITVCVVFFLMVTIASAEAQTTGTSPGASSNVPSAATTANAIVMPAGSGIYEAGSTATLTFVVPVSVEVSKYQWLKEGVPLADNDRFTGAETKTLVISPILVQDSGHYSLRITLASTSEVIESSQMHVQVVPEGRLPLVNGGSLLALTAVLALAGARFVKQSV